MYGWKRVGYKGILELDRIGQGIVREGLCKVGEGREGEVR